MPTVEGMMACWEAERAMGIDYTAMRNGEYSHRPSRPFTGKHIGAIRVDPVTRELIIDRDPIRKPYNKHYHRKTKK